MREGVEREGVMREGVEREGVMREGVEREGVWREGVEREVWRLLGMECVRERVRKGLLRGSDSLQSDENVKCEQIIFTHQRTHTCKPSFVITDITECWYS